MKILMTLLSLTFSLSLTAADDISLNCGGGNGKYIIIRSQESVSEITANFRHNFFTSDLMVCSGLEADQIQCIGYINGTSDLIEITTKAISEGKIIAEFKQIRGGTLVGKMACK